MDCNIIIAHHSSGMRDKMHNALHELGCFVVQAVTKNDVKTCLTKMSLRIDGLFIHHSVISHKPEQTIESFLQESPELRIVVWNDQKAGFGGGRVKQLYMLPAMPKDMKEEMRIALGLIGIDIPA